ncbi:ATP-binding cassette domain-containing protein [Cellulosilyticum sp. ST5]|uniref:ATP-binding cassette domain-containing protein n=1 Tax=unclassified Cellulosilyticum TaxID=2643091 RepID=UPI001A9AFEE5|nr:ATP-binding cassette domain-containing protein [Cellulosilyticum sp. WCF-2]
MSSSDRAMITCESIFKIYKSKEVEVLALQGLDLTVEKGELVAIIGNSGSGKSTLLNMIGGLDKPSAGSVIVAGINLEKMNNKELQQYFLKTVGFVWQNNARNLIPYLTAVENVEMPMILAKEKEKRSRALELLKCVGLEHRISSKLQELSGGEQQRVAIALALANRPRVLLADEPTGSVDSLQTKKIMEVLQKVNKQEGVTVVIVTHDQELSKMVDRVINIRDGRVSSEFLAKQEEQAKDGEVGLENISNTHDEWIVIDKVGRLQLPKDIVKELHLKNWDKLQVHMEEERIILERGK